MPPAQTLSPEDIGRVRDGFDRIWPVSDRMVETFYDRLFETEPGLRALFRGDMTEQKRKFISTLAGIIAHLDNDTARFSITGTLGRHHDDYGVAAAHYPVVREALIWTLAQALGPAWAAEDAASWRRAYDCVSAEMLSAASA